MSEREGLKAARKLVRRRGERVAPSAEPFVPELRSNIKWKPTTAQVAAFRAEAFILVVWCYGVPFEQIDGFHDWLATNEITLANLCANGTNNKAHYLGTYLHLDTGGPRYQTYWGLTAAADAETALATALTNKQLHDLVIVLRSYWVRDPNATDLRYGQARHYINVDQLQIDSAFWQVTKDAPAVPPQ